MTKPIIIATPNFANKSADVVLAEVENLASSGATIVTLNPRKAEQKRAIEPVKQKFGDEIIIQLSAEGEGVYSPEQQMKLIKELKPESVLIPLLEFLPHADYEIEAEEFFTWVKENKIIAQYVLKSADELRYFIDLADQRIIPEGDNFVLFAPKKEPGNMAPFIKVLKETGVKLNWVAAVSNLTNAQNIIEQNGGVALTSAEMIKSLVDGNDALKAKELKKRLS